jgi:hypothetical protein
MPTKRTAVGAPMRLEVVDWLLEGRVRLNDEHDPLRRAAVYDPFLEFVWWEAGPDLLGLWQQHRAWLRAEFARRGGVGEPWAACLDRVHV